MYAMRPIMTHTNLLTSLTWGRWRRADVSVTVERESADEDDCVAAYIEELEPEWLHALESADYSHLPKLKKIPA
jgi:hypothetical protein